MFQTFEFWEMYVMQAFIRVLIFSEYRVDDEVAIWFLQVALNFSN